ncbi:unnamed protein product [Phaeothamnion confervicola]
MELEGPTSASPTPAPQDAAPKHPAGDGGGEKRSSKKRARSTVRVRVPPPGDAAVGPPLLVSFRGRPVPSDGSEIRFKLHEHTKNEGKRILTGKTDRLEFWAKNTGVGRDLANFCVGVLDDVTGEMTLHEVGHVYGLQQKVRGVDDVVEDRATAMEDLAYKERRGILIDAFGSKKSKAAAAVAASNIIDAEHVVGGAAALGTVLSSSGDGGGASSGGTPSGTGAAASAMIDAGAEAEEAGRRRLLPPYHADAGTPAGVYLVEEMVRREDLAALGREADRLATAHPQGEGHWLRSWVQNRSRAAAGDKNKKKFSRHALSRLWTDAGAPPRERMLPLLHLNCMVAFHQASSFSKTTPAAVAKELSIPEVVARGLLAGFTLCGDDAGDGGGGGRRTFARDKFTRERLCVHALCLALVLEGCTLDFGALAADLALTPAAAAALLRQLGCAVTTGMPPKARLTVPLAFPRRRGAGGDARK